MDSEQNNNTYSPEKIESTLLSMAIESWRFSKVFNRLLSKVDAGEQGRYIGQMRWFIKKIEDSLAESGLKLVNVEGQQFDPGMAVTPLNIEEFESDDVLIVEQMLEPIIMGEQGLLKTGTVTLRKVES